MLVILYIFCEIPEIAFYIIHLYFMCVCVALRHNHHQKKEIQRKLKTTTTCTLTGSVNVGKTPKVKKVCE